MAEESLRNHYRRVGASKGIVASSTRSTAGSPSRIARAIAAVVMPVVSKICRGWLRSKSSA